MFSKNPFRHDQPAIITLNEKLIELILRDASPDMAIESLKQPSRGIPEAIRRIDRSVRLNGSLIDIC